MKNQKPVIFLDFDGLKFETLPVYISYINKKYNIESQTKDYINNPPIEDIVKRYKKEILNSWEIAKRYREKINPTIIGKAT
jgi:hypothetical protein